MENARSDTPEIRTLLIDIGGVLLTNGWDRATRREAALHFDLDPEEMQERHHLTFDAYEEGKLSLDEYMERVVFYEPRTFTRADFRNYMFDQSQPYEEMIDLVARLRRRHRLRVAAVSNEGRELTIHRIRTFDLKRIIDVFISSCFVHYRKPDHDIFKLALDITQEEPEHALYIDDRPLFVAVASALGVRGIVHEGLESTRQALAGFGLNAEPARDRMQPGSAASIHD